MKMPLFNMTRRPASINPLLFVLAFTLWIIPFRKFFIGTTPLDADAISYYEHIKFFIDNMLQGVFPLWDPTWYFGMPNEFFLRRLCPYNPFYLLIAGLRLIGLQHILAYVIFLAVYHALGLIGFYRCARYIFKDTSLAFVSFLLLLFSPLSYRLFDSYILLVFTPGVWFFSFLLSFYKKPVRRNFLGTLFCLMLLLNTYIPFYFLIIFGFFILTSIVVLPQTCQEFFSKLYAFARENWLLCIVCLALLTATVLPGVMFFLSAQNQEIVFPMRHSLSTEKNTLAVDSTWITGWGTLEEILYSSFYPRFKDFHFSLLYIPVAFMLLFGISLITKINRLIILLFCWAGSLLILTMPRAFDLYSFLYQHVFFFKYFKNLQFFLWLAVLPISCLLLTEFWRQIRDVRVEGTTRRIGNFLFLGALVGGLAVAFLVWGHRELSTYLTLAAAFLLFAGVWKGIVSARNSLLLISLIIVMQPLDVFVHLNLNQPQLKAPAEYAYDRPYNALALERSVVFSDQVGYAPGNGALLPLYVTVADFGRLYENIPPKAISNLVKHKFILYDNVTETPPGDQAYLPVARHFTDMQGPAYAEGLPPGHIAQMPSGKSGPFFPAPDSSEFRLLKADVNTVHLRTNFSQKKILVFTDNFHKGWQAQVNGKPAVIFKTDIAFKGLLLDPGENKVTFRFGTDRRYALNFFLFCVFYVIFLLLVLPKRLTSRLLDRDRSS